MWNLMRVLAVLLRGGWKAPAFWLVLSACERAPAPKPSTPLSSVPQNAATGRARIEGGWVFVELDQPALQESCQDFGRVEQLHQGRWTALRDERPPSHENPGYFLDGVYQAPSQNEGCDVRGCQAVTGKLRIGEAAEYVRTGTAQDPQGRAVSKIERQPVSGELRAVVPLRSGTCEKAVESVFAVAESR